MKLPRISIWRSWADAPITRFSGEKPGPDDDVMDLTRAYLENKRELDYKMEEWSELNEKLEQ